MNVDVSEIYEKYGPMVYRRILRFYREQEAEEILHEVFVKVLENIDSFREDASPSTWLYRITTNHCLNRLRNSKRREELWLEHGESAFPTRNKANQEKALLLRVVWQTLPEELVQIGTYYYLDGMTHAEIARVVGVSRRTVGNRLDVLTLIVRKAADASQELVAK